MKLRKLFKDEWGLDRDWFIFVKGILFILIFSAVAFLLTAAVSKPYEGTECFCECQEEEE